MIDRPALEGLGFDELIKEIDWAADELRDREGKTILELVELFEWGVTATRLSKKKLVNAHTRVQRAQESR